MNRERTTLSYPWGGHEFIETYVAAGWQAIASWGRDGWDLGSWPLTVVMHWNGSDHRLAYYVEGDVTIDTYRTRQERDRATDELAFFHWRHEEESWIAGISPGEEPEHLRGPFSWARLETQAVSS